MKWVMIASGVLWAVGVAWAWAAMVAGKEKYPK